MSTPHDKDTLTRKAKRTGQVFLEKLHVSAKERRAKNIETRFGQGEYFRIIIRPSSDFIKLRMEASADADVIQQINGKRADGRWNTQSWLIHKSAAHLEADKLVADNQHAKKLLQALDHKMVLIEKDTFKI